MAPWLPQGLAQVTWKFFVLLVMLRRGGGVVAGGKGVVLQGRGPLPRDAGQEVSYGHSANPTPA